MFKRFIAPLRHIKWVVYCKAPFGEPEQVLRYLSRYAHRVAISNRRLVAAYALQRATTSRLEPEVNAGAHDVLVKGHVGRRRWGNGVDEASRHA